jgi:hypothetical protein
MADGDPGFSPVRNCVFYNCTTAIDGEKKNLDIRYSVFQACTLAIDMTDANSNLFEKYNCFYNNTAIGFTLDSTDITDNPDFVDPANGDFTITSTSPLVNAGPNNETFGAREATIPAASYAVFVPGSSAETIVVQDSLTNVLEGASVDIYTDSTMTNFVNGGTTDSYGEYGTNLDTGTYYVKITKAGYSFTNPTTLSVTASPAFETYIPGSTSTTIQLVDDSGNPIAGAFIELFSDSGMTTFVSAGATGTYGKATFDLNSGTYYVKITATRMSFTVPETVTV